MTWQRCAQNVRASPLGGESPACACRVRAVIGEVEAQLSQGRKVYLHCWGGRGRAGTFGACLLGAMYGMSVEEGLLRVQRAFATRGDGGAQFLLAYAVSVRNHLIRCMHQVPSCRRLLFCLAALGSCGGAQEACSNACMLLCRIFLAGDNAAGQLRAGLFQGLVAARSALVSAAAPSRLM